jgi:hypothetical protein
MKRGRPRLVFDYSKAQQLLDSGLSVRKVALQLGVHHNTLQHHVNQGFLLSGAAGASGDYDPSYRMALRSARCELLIVTAERDALNQRVEMLAETIRVLTGVVDPDEGYAELDECLTGLS